MRYFFFVGNLGQIQRVRENAGTDTEGKKIDCGSEIQSIF